VLLKAGIILKRQHEIKMKRVSFDSAGFISVHFSKYKKKKFFNKKIFFTPLKQIWR